MSSRSGGGRSRYNFGNPTRSEAAKAAIAEVLQIINSSPGDLAPVFDTIEEKAHTLCGSGRGTLFLRAGEGFRPAAMRAVPEPLAERLRQGQMGLDAPPVGPILDKAHALCGAKFGGLGIRDGNGSIVLRPMVSPASSPPRLRNWRGSGD